MKRLIMLLLAAIMILTMLAPAAYASETEETTEATEVAEETEAAEEKTDETEEEKEPVSTATSGTCGNMTWNLEGSTLTVTGSGEMEKGAPWAHLADKVKKLVLSGGITTVAEGAFQDFDELTSVDFGGSLKEVGPQAFQGCDGLEYISLPETFRKFGAQCFMECSSLTEVYCAGPMPSFRGNCLWNGNLVTVYCTQDYVWPRESVEELERNLGGRLQVMTSGGSDLFTNAQPEEDVVPVAIAETQPETEPVTEPVTVPVTEPMTEPATIPTAAPETMPVTEPEEDAGPDWREELEQTVPVENAEKTPGSRSWIGLALIVGVLTFAVAGALVVRSVSRKDGRYSE